MRVALVVSLLITLAAFPRAASEYLDRLTRTLQIPATLPLVLRASVGDIAIAGWRRPEVAIEITRRAASLARLSALPIVIATTESGTRVTVLQDEGGKDAALQGSIVLRVPVDQALGDVELFEGRIVLNGLRGGVRAHVEHGSIQAASLAGRIRLESSIGDVRLERAELTERGMIRLRTFNGNVALDFGSPPAHARILALSLAGTIRSDLPLALRTGFGPRFGEALIGRGAPVVSIDVVHGDIRITSGKT